MTESNDVGKASAKNSYYYFLGQISSFMIAAVTTILVGRFLGPENYGAYNVGLIVPLLLISLCDIGISPSLIRFTSKFRFEGKHEKSLSLIKIGISFKTLLSLVASFLLFLFADNVANMVLNRPQISILIRLGSVYVFGGSLFDTVTSTYVGLDESGKYGLLINIQTILKAAVSLSLILIGFGAMGATLGIGFSYLFAVVIGISMLFLHSVLTQNRSQPDDNISYIHGLRTMTNYGMPLYLGTLILNLSNRYQGLILSLLTSNIEIGNYTTAINFSTFVSLLVQPMAIALFPAFSKLTMEKDKNYLKKMFGLSIKYTALLVTPVSLALSLFSRELVYALYGAQYMLAPGYLALYSIIYLCPLLGTVVITNFLNGQGNTKMTMGINLVSLAIIVPLAPLFTVLYSVTGLIVSALIAHVFSAILGLFLVLKNYGLAFDWLSSIKIIVASFLTFLFVYIFLRFFPISNVIYRLAFGGLLYLVIFLIVVPLIRAIDETDIKNLTELTEKLPILHPIAKHVLNLERRILVRRLFTG